MTRLTLRIDFDDRRQLGPGKVRLLELIAAHGSISAASRHMGMSYRRAWGLIEQLNAMFAEPLVEAQTGGAGGGKAALTPRGHQVVRGYRAIERGAVEAAATEMEELRASLASPGE